MTSTPHRRVTPRAPTDATSDSNFWAVVAPFLFSGDVRWISDFAESDRHTFSKVPHGATQASWHDKKVARTGMVEWARFSQTAHRALRAAHELDGGVITVFPQLAAAVGLQKRVTRRDVPLVSWFFNTNLRPGSRGQVARRALAAVDRFVVHSRVEIGVYARELDLEAERFSFAHVQYGGPVQDDPEDKDNPYVFATGSGFRDYGTLFAALQRLGLPAKVVAGDRVLSGLTIPPNVEVLEGVGRTDIHRLMRGARVNVVPLTLGGLTAGIITVVETYRHGRGLVITRRSGLEDYVIAGETGLQVEHADPGSMADAIDAMWNDECLRQHLGAGADEFARLHCTDHAAAARLIEVLDEVVGYPAHSANR